MPSITPYLWFEHDAAAAVAFYQQVFKSASAADLQDFGNDLPGPAEGVIQASMTLLGQKFLVLNGGENGADSKFNDAVSFLISCDTQDEIDYYWDALTADGGQPVQCGWLKDKYGLRWQVIPSNLDSLMTDADPAKAKAAQQAMLQMVKLDIATLQAAHDNA